MLPLINSLTTEFAGLTGDSTGDLPASDESGRHFAGILRQSVAGKPSMEPGHSSGNALPLDGKILPLELEGAQLPMLEIELPAADLFDNGLPAIGSTEPETILYGLDLLPKPISAAISRQLIDDSLDPPSEGELAIAAIAIVAPSETGAPMPAPFVEHVESAGTPVTPPLGLIAEQRLLERNGSNSIVGSADSATANLTDIELPVAYQLSRGLGPEQRLVVPAPAADQPSLTAASIHDGAMVAIQASKVAAEVLGGAPEKLTGGPIDGTASLNNSSLPGHVSMPGTVPPASTASPPASVPVMHIGSPLQDPAWSHELGSRVLLMSGQQLQSAKIQISPAELGPITVNLVVDDGSADLTFHAHHVLTRDAIEQALPRLREMLNDNGLTLGNATVSDQGVHQEGFGRGSQEASSFELAVDETMIGDESRDLKPARVLQGLLDTFV